MSEQEMKGTTTQRLQDCLDEHGTIYWLNVAHPSVNKKNVAEKWAQHGICTISDWGLTKRHNVELFGEQDVKVSANTVRKEFQDGDEINWWAVRDAIAEHQFANRDNPNYPAGQARGSIRRFVDEYDIGTRILGNFPTGTAVGVVESACFYDPENPVAADFDSDHVFKRKVQWARDEDGGVMTVDMDLLPDSLSPGRPATVAVDDNDVEDIITVARFIDGLIGE